MCRPVLALAAVLVISSVARGEYVTLGATAEALLRRAPGVGQQPDRYSLEGPNFDQLAVFTTHEGAASGVLLFDLGGLAGEEVAYAEITVHVLRTQANLSLPIELGAVGFADGDGLIEVAEVQVGAPTTTLGYFEPLVANQQDIDVAITLDVTAFVRSLAAGSTGYAGFQLGPFAGLNQGFTLAASGDSLGRGPTLGVLFAVPEPGSLGLVGLGLALARKRRAR